MQDVTVIGAGVIGLSTAICLAEAGARVAMHAAELPGQTTSVAAGAVWGPHLVGTDERVARWAEVTLGWLHGLTAQPFVHVASGITAIAATADDTRPGQPEPPEFAAASPDHGQPEPPEFAATAANLVACSPADVPPGYVSAWRLSAPLVSMPDYLDFLYSRYLQAGGQPITRVSYPTMADAAAAAPGRVLVNCSGSGAHRLVPDPAVIPVRGQVVVARNPGIAEFFVGVGAAEADLTYVFPHGDHVVLGGTEQPGDWSLKPDPITADRILAACATVQPALRAAVVVAHRVGLRPFRPEVRLETERVSDGTTIVHNYGHGGAGVTLSWGCAEDAAALVLSALGA